MAPEKNPLRLPDVTQTAPHIRDSMNVRTAMGILVISLIPPCVMAVYNTGIQANLAMARLGVESAPGWRGALIDYVGAGYDPSILWASVIHGALYFFPIFLTTVVTASCWAWLFAKVRKRQMGPGLISAALVVTLLLPPTMPLWLAALGMSFGILLGREVFGGFGRNIFNPAVVTLAFLHIAYPAETMASWVWVPVEGYIDGNPLELAQKGGVAALGERGVNWMDAFLGYVPGAMGDTSTLAIATGAGILLWTGLASWRVIFGVLFGAFIVAILFSAGGAGDASMFALPWAWHLVLGSFAFGVVYLASDPFTAASTNKGRWIYGVVIGGLTILLRVAGPAHSDGTIFAILLGSIFAPTIDYAVMSANIRRRGRRHVG